MFLWWFFKDGCWMKSCCFWQAKFRYSCWLCDILNKRYRIDMYRHGLSSSIQSVLRDGDVLISDPDRKRMKTRWAKSTRDELSKPVSSRGDLSWTNLPFPLVFCGCANCNSVIWIYLEGFPIQFTARRESSEICPMEVVFCIKDTPPRTWINSIFDTAKAANRYKHHKSNVRPKLGHKTPPKRCEWWGDSINERNHPWFSQVLESDIHKTVFLKPLGILRFSSTLLVHSISRT